ncbi:MAG: TIGR00266 family protein [Anaerolineales bacterium]
MQYNIKGDVIQTLDIRLSAGEAVFTELGGMAWMTDGIEMKTSGRGGIGKMLGRAFSGESLLLTTYTAESDGAMIAFTPEYMGNIIPVELGAGESIIAQRDAFMCGTDGVDVSIHFKRKIGAGLFGGEGFILQKCTGPGTVFVEMYGEVVDYTLKPGQRLQIDPGHIAMYEPTVDYDIKMVKGFRNIFLGGEGLFLATLTGPGKVWLQTQPLLNLAMAVYDVLPKDNDDDNDSGSDLAGNIIKNLLD